MTDLTFLVLETGTYLVLAAAFFLIVYFTAIRFTKATFWWIVYGGFLGSFIAGSISFGLYLLFGGWGPPALPAFVTIGLFIGGAAGFAARKTDADNHPMHRSGGG